jgi:hypothetical protein
MPLLGSIEKNIEVNPLLKHDTSVPLKYYTGTVESQEPIEGFWDEGVVFWGGEGLKHRDIETQRHGEHREERGQRRKEREKMEGEEGAEKRADGWAERKAGGGPRALCLCLSEQVA